MWIDPRSACTLVQLLTVLLDGSRSVTRRDWTSRPQLRGFEVWMLVACVAQSVEHARGA